MERVPGPCGTGAREATGKARGLLLQLYARIRPAASESHVKIRAAPPEKSFARPMKNVPVTPCEMCRNFSTNARPQCDNAVEGKNESLIRRTRDFHLAIDR